jgi:prepilin-type N-terminal cleavage/methylation domain-containing protein
VARNRKPLPALLLLRGTAPAIEPGSESSWNRAIPRRGENIVQRRDGFTLIETLLVVVLLGLIVLIGLPKMSSAMVRTDLRGARTTMVNMVAKARAASVQSNRITWVKVEGTSVYVGATPRLVFLAGSDADTVGAVQDLAELYGVAVAAEGVDSIQFDPRGFGSGFAAAADTITLSRDGHSSIVIVDGLGRVRK